MRIFLDTNVLLSGLLGRGLCRDLLDLVVERHTLVLSEQVLRESERHLRRKFGVPASERRAFAFLMREVAEVVPDAEPPAGVRVPDPDDRAIVGAAIAAGAACLVTGDSALLRMVAPEGLPVRSPREAWVLLRDPGVGPAPWHGRGPA